MYLAFTKVGKRHCFLLADLLLSAVEMLRNQRGDKVALASQQLSFSEWCNFTRNGFSSCPESSEVFG